MIGQIPSDTTNAYIGNTGTSQNHLRHLLGTKSSLIIYPAVFLKTVFYICRRNHADNRSYDYQDIGGIPVQIKRMHTYHAPFFMIFMVGIIAQFYSFVTSLLSFFLFHVTLSYIMSPRSKCFFARTYILKRMEHFIRWNYLYHLSF